MTATRRDLLAAIFAGALPSLPARALAAPAAASARGATAAADAHFPPVLPTLWRDGLDPAAYLVSEKWDGVRAVWNGTRLAFRSGRPVPAPAWFTARLPRTPLDGELWLGRGRFDELSAAVRRQAPVDAEWRTLRYGVFELPGAAGSFAERAERLATVVRDATWSQLVAVAQERVADRAALRRRLTQTVAAGGEGLMLHLASAPYVGGRSDVLMKLKPELDAEAVVSGYRAGRGKYEGQVGALELRAPDGRRFFVGSGLSDELRRTPPPVGSSVTYRYRELTPGGLPRFASFLRLHHPL